jgi:uncharacterized protein
VRIDNDFLVQAPIEEVWDFMLDVEKVAPCVPGAELTETLDDHTWKGKVLMKLGPVSLSYAGTVTIQERDDEHHRVSLKAEGREQRGKGAASATSTSVLTSVDGGTKVVIETDLTITGAVAQYGRGMIGDVSRKVTDEFAACLQANITATRPVTVTDAVAAGVGVEPATVPSEEAEGSAPPAKPLGGIRLGLWAFWRAVVRVVRRLLGGRTT